MSANGAAFCTIVEFEWDSAGARAVFEQAVHRLADAAPPATGRLSRIVGIDDTGARVVEVWESGQAAATFASQSGPALSVADMPAPVRVVGFEVTEYDTT